MDSGSRKIYHVHGYDSRQFLEDYMSDKPDMVFGDDALKFPIENFKKIFTRACEFFQHIIVLKVSDRCIMELKRWLDSRTGAFDWGHITKIHAEIEGNSDQFQDKEEKLRSTIPHVMKCDLEKINMTDPIDLPPADCIISFSLLDVISKDKDDYRRYLRKFSGLLKPEGHLILFGGLDMTYYMVGKDKLHAFPYDEDFARKTLAEEGFVIDDCKVGKRTAVSDLIDYKGMIFIAAHKEK